MTYTETYLAIIIDILDTIADMRESGDYDDDTLEALENRLEKM
jgi:hypothetical protein